MASVNISYSGGNRKNQPIFTVYGNIVALPAVLLHLGFPPPTIGEWTAYRYPVKM
jgi:hypothetical protein